MKTTLVFAAFAASLGLAGCGDDAPSADDVTAALTQRAQHAFFDCPLLQYRDVHTGEPASVDGGASMYRVVASYDVQSLFAGHDSRDMEKARALYARAQKMPGWFPDQCRTMFEKFQSGQVQGGQAMKIAMIMQSEFQKAGEANSFEGSVQAFMDGGRTLHVAQARLNLRRGDHGWRIVTE